MPDAALHSLASHDLPSWVPVEIRSYLLHTVSGFGIRELARRKGVHASTVLRHVRAVEAQREDILIDRALGRLEARMQGAQEPHGATADGHDATLSEAEIAAEGRRVLRRMCESGAVLAVAADMDNAVVVREMPGGETTRLAVVARAFAEAMALRGWIGCDRPARISRYRITRAGRAALGRLLAGAENRALGLVEARDALEDAAPAREPARQRHRSAETPLALLARRSDPRGEKFLTADLVRAGERLREDYEMADLGARKGESWDVFLSNAESATATGSPVSRAARRRIIGALRDLGPGLGDVALRCCCHLEGLEQAEKSLGWSARSGKVVLRIALQRLRSYYRSLGEAADLIG